MSETHKHIAIIGAGPAGLAAAEALATAGHAVSLYEAMPSPSRKFLLAGKSGLNITHSEPMPAFEGRYGSSAARLQGALAAFDNAAVLQWMAELGQEHFVGSSGRVFPKAMKASPLLRAWLARLQGLGVTLYTRHKWQGFEGAALVFDTPDGRATITADGVVLALGGASWPRLGSDGAWTALLQDKGVAVTPLEPSNCGFDVPWSAHFVERFAGEPIKAVRATSYMGSTTGEFVISKSGVEGSLIYAHSAALRDQLTKGETHLLLDLAPNRTLERLIWDLKKQNPKQSLSNRLRKGAGLTGAKAGLLREFAAEDLYEPEQLASAIKSLALPITAPRPIAEAISSDGGVGWDGVDENYMLSALPGVFVAGEMLDWDAPTGGYLITASMATGRAAAKGVMAWFEG